MSVDVNERVGTPTEHRDPARGTTAPATRWLSRLAFDKVGAVYVWLAIIVVFSICLLYTSPSPRDGLLSRMPSSA